MSCLEYSMKKLRKLFNNNYSDINQLATLFKMYADNIIRYVKQTYIIKVYRSIQRVVTKPKNKYMSILPTAPNNICYLV